MYQPTFLPIMSSGPLFINISTVSKVEMKGHEATIHFKDGTTLDVGDRQDAEYIQLLLGRLSGMKDRETQMDL